MSRFFLADSIGKAFGGKKVLSSATAWAERGRITALMGRNGSGKTTLLRAALGLARASHGMVRFDGRTYLRPRLWRLAAEGLLYLPDRGLLSRRTTFGEQLALLAARFPEAEPDAATRRFATEDLENRYVTGMSSGERRLAELTFAVARRSRCVLADEPFAEVAPKERERVAEVLSGMAHDGVALLVTGHEVHDLLAVAHEVIWMVAGTTHGLGTPDEARAHDQFRREYLGPRG